MGIIYRLSFPNGKIYIGLTAGTLTRRLASHRYCAMNEDRMSAVHRAWKKYGEPKSEILAFVENHLLSEHEIRAIRVFNSFGKSGYNLTQGGDISPMKNKATVEKVRKTKLLPENILKNRLIHLGLKRSEESKLRMSIARKGQGLGVPKSKEHRAKLALKSKGNNHCLGRKHSVETIRKMSLSASKRWAK